MGSGRPQHFPWEFILQESGRACRLYAEGGGAGGAKKVSKAAGEGPPRTGPQGEGSNGMCVFRWPGPGSSQARWAPGHAVLGSRPVGRRQNSNFYYGKEGKTDAEGGRVGAARRRGLELSEGRPASLGEAQGQGPQRARWLRTET